MALQSASAVELAVGWAEAYFVSCTCMGSTNEPSRLKTTPPYPSLVMWYRTAAGKGEAISFAIGPEDPSLLVSSKLVGYVGSDLIRLGCADAGGSGVGR